MSIVCMGEVLIDFVALESGVTVGEASGFVKAPGGAPANVCVAAARLGMPAAFLGQVGDDPFGHHLSGVLAHEGIDVRGLLFSREARTMLAFVSLAADGERSFSFYRNPSADMLLRPEEVVYDVLDDKRIFHYGSITMIDEPSRSALLATLDYARDHGLIISYDPNLRLNLWPDAETARAGMISGLDYATVLKVSEEELEFMTGGHDVSPLWRDGMKLIVVTRGAAGSRAYTRSAQAEAPGFAVTAVDTTGAGDGFVAALLAGVLEHGAENAEMLPEMLRFANAVGAITTTKKGAIPALPTRAEALAFMAQRA
ncbi:MAG: fructokinase [Anaerolineae bacterium]|nr:fructokinase [Anaerolineae bacterium]